MLPYITLLSGGSFGCTTIFTSIWQNFFCQMGPLLGVDPGLPFGLYFFPLTSEQLSIIYIKCQEHISEQFLFLLLFCFCWHWWSEGPICGTFLQESKSWSKLSPYHRFEGTSKTEIDQGFQKSWSHPRQSILWFIINESLSSLSWNLPKNKGPIWQNFFCQIDVKIVVQPNVPPESSVQGIQTRYPRK